MKKIPLTQNQFALADDEDFEELSKHKWYARKTSYGGFVAVRNVTIAPYKQTSIPMHRQITNAPKDSDVDHRNHHTLDNQKHNLRTCTRSQNQHNQLPHKSSSSQYKGVCWDKRRKKWCARINLNKRNRYLGHFTLEIDAAKAYNQAAKEMFGEFARLNDV